MRSALFWDIMQRRAVILYRRFGTTYPSHLQGSRRSLKMRPLGCPESSVQNYRSTLRNVPEDRRCHLHSGGSLKWRFKIHFVLLFLNGFFISVAPILFIVRYHRKNPFVSWTTFAMSCFETSDKLINMWHSKARQNPPSVAIDEKWEICVRSTWRVHWMHIRNKY